MILRSSLIQNQALVSLLLVIIIVQALLSTTDPSVGSTHDTLTSHRSCGYGVDVCGDFSLDQDPLKAHGCILQNEEQKGRPAQGVEGYQHCFFFQENFDMAFCAIEELMHDVVKKIIEPEDVVLEIGSRWNLDIYLNHC